MKVLAMLQALDIHRLRGTPKGICTDRNIGTWKGRSMELTAAIEALQAVALEGRKIVVYSDSQYVKNGITSWIKNWKKNGWRTAAKKPVLNQDLWVQLDTLYNSLDVEWKWVKGHAGVEYNEVCDQLCQMEIAKFE